MAIRGGYARHVLRVDISRGTIATEPLPSEELLRAFVGGTGLGTYYPHLTALARPSQTKGQEAEIGA